MQFSPYSRRTLIIVVLVGIVIFSIFFYYYSHKKSTQIVPVPLVVSIIVPHEQEKTIYKIPKHLKISTINVDANIESVGLTSQGAMDTPKNPDDAAWFEPGTHPGEIGSAVITGHFGISKNGKGSVFDDLDKLHQGDKISIEDDKGTIITFVMRENKLYDPKDDASDVFNSNDGKAHLNLVTCEGVFNTIFENYPKRLVIFTDKE